MSVSLFARRARLAVLLGLLSAAVSAWAEAPADARPANSRVSAVTVYTNTALVTREVAVPDGTGVVELVVTPLPPQVVANSLYAEGSDGLRVMTVRYRTRLVREDVSEEVRKLEAQIRELRALGERLASEVDTVHANLAAVAKLEGFTSVTTVNLTEKGKLDSEQTLALVRFVFEQRDKLNRQLIDLKQKSAANAEQMDFLSRQLSRVAGRGGKTERDAIIVVDKRAAPAGRVRLNYLVGSASWRPAYKLRAGKDRDPVLVEYLAAVNQNTGEDWTDAAVTLSNAQPLLNAAPPELKSLEVALTRLPIGSGGHSQAPLDPNADESTGRGGASLELAVPGLKLSYERARQNRANAQRDLNEGRAASGNKAFNDAAAEEQAAELLAPAKNPLLAQAAANDELEGPSVTYRLDGKLSIPTRDDEQIVEIARIEMTPEFTYRAIPVLTKHVYRTASLTNRSNHVLLPGEATMYLGSDFVGRMPMAAVAIGEKFDVGFGVDPQLQVARKLLDKKRTVQGGNQILTYDYQILVSSYKTEPVKLALWDRLPTAESAAVAVTLTSQTPELSKDVLYVREERPKNLLRWDLTIPPNTPAEKAVSVTYSFKMELDRQMRVTGVVSK